MPDDVKGTAISDANRIYFQTLAHSRASLGNLAAIPIVVIVLLGVVTFGLDVLSTDRGYDIVGLVRDVNFVLIVINGIVLVFSVFGRLLYRFQVVFSAVAAFLSLGLVYTLCSMTLPLVAFLNVSDQDVATTLFSIGASVTLASMCGSIVVHSLMLRHRLRVGHSQERTIGNFVAVSSSNRSKIMWITFGVVAVVPNVLTSGEYLANSFGALALVFFACVTPSLPVEFAYLAYLKSKDRVYWDARPPRMPVEERRRLIRTIVLWVVGIAVAIAAFWIFATNFRAGV